MVVGGESEEATVSEGREDGTREVDDDGECGSGCDISRFVCGGDAVSPVQKSSIKQYNLIHYIFKSVH